MNPQLSQQELAAWIDREGLAFEVLEWAANGTKAFWRSPSDDLDVLYYLEADYEIRLAPGALNEWNLPHGTEPHNPDGLTPEQITEGGQYRAVTLEELSSPLPPEAQYFRNGKWKWKSFRIAYGLETTYRVPITTPLPAVKESLTPQPATGQSQTPRTDAAEAAYAGWKQKLGTFKSVTDKSQAVLNPQLDGFDFARTLETELRDVLSDTTYYIRKEAIERLETELTAALTQRDEARETLDLMCDEFQRIKALAGLPPEAHTFCERAISGIKQRVPLVEQRDKAEKERDEARRLLGEAGSALALSASRLQRLALECGHGSPIRFDANTWASETKEKYNQITNHLNK